MTELKVVPIYLAVGFIFYFILRIKVSILRGAKGISIGDEGDQELLLSIRKHANYIENFPFFLICLTVAELRGVESNFLNLLGILFFVSRAMHVIGLKASDPKNKIRIISGILTSLSILTLILLSLR